MKMSKVYDYVLEAIVKRLEEGDIQEICESLRIQKGNAV